MKMPFSRIFSRIVPAEGQKIRGAEKQSVMQGFASNSTQIWVGGLRGMPLCSPISTGPKADDDMAVHFHHRKRAEQCNPARKTQQICYGRGSHRWEETFKGGRRGEVGNFK